MEVDRFKKTHRYEVSAGEMDLIPEYASLPVQTNTAGIVGFAVVAGRGSVQNRRRAANDDRRVAAGSSKAGRTDLFKRQRTQTVA